MAYSSNSFNLEILNQKNIFEDGYDELHSYDDCILNTLAKTHHDTYIREILKAHEQKRITNSVEETVLRNLSNLLEYATESGMCKAPNLKLQVGFKMTSQNLITASPFEKGYKFPLKVGLEFPRSMVVKEVN